MYAVGKFIPVRFLALIAHFVILVILLWSLDSSLKTCLPVGYTQDEYDQANTELTVGLSVAIALFGFEMISFLMGISMFVASVAMISIFTHVCAAVTLSLFILESWECQRYWYIFGFCSALPALFEISVLLLFLMGKRK